MAKYTVELSNIIASYANLVDPQNNEEKYTIKDLNGNDLTYYQNDFNYFALTNPNKLCNDYAAKMLRHYCYDLPQNFTDNEELNTAILDKFLVSFCLHFYGDEIGQENTNYFFVVLQSFFNEHLPFFIQAYKKLMIEQKQWLTNENDSTSNNTANANANTVGTNSNVSGSADTPQDELNFKINTGDPTDDYNFNYSSSVVGAKGKDSSTSTQDSTSDTKNQSEGRNATIASLVNELLMYSNGVYLEMFRQARRYGLFMNKKA